MGKKKFKYTRQLRWGNSLKEIKFYPRVQPGFAGVSHLQGFGNTYPRVVLVAKRASPVLRVPPGLSLASLSVSPRTMGEA